MCLPKALRSKYSTMPTPACAVHEPISPWSSIGGAPLPEIHRGRQCRLVGVDHAHLGEHGLDRRRLAQRLHLGCDLITL